MEPVDSIGIPKKAVEKITDVGPDGETFTADYEITFVFKGMHRSEYLRICRALKLDQICNVSIDFAQTEMHMHLQDGSDEEWKLP